MRYGFQYVGFGFFIYCGDVWLMVLMVCWWTDPNEGGVNRVETR